MGKKVLVKDGQLWLDNICLLPVISGRASFAYAVREAFFSTKFDCVAVGLPLSFQSLLLQGIDALPFLTVIISRESTQEYCYFPVDPCDGMVEAARLAHEEFIPLRFIDREMDHTPASGLVLPDEYAIERIGLSAYIQSIFPALSGDAEKEVEGDAIQSRFMASRLRELGIEYGKVLFVFSVHHLPGILRFYQAGYEDFPDGIRPKETGLYSLHPDSLYLLLGEIPYFTFLYERLKGAISFEEFEKTGAIKRLLLEAREEYYKEFPEDIYRVSPQDIQTALQFIRNLCCIKERLTPDLYELVVAAKGVVGNDFALKLIEVAKFYPFMAVEHKFSCIRMTDRYIYKEKEGISAPAHRRVPALAKEWKRVSLEKRPGKKQRKVWRTCWNPNTVCSWPPEDEVIEDFCGYIRKRALKLVGITQVRVEEFQSTLKDGIHLRETLRNWHLGKIYVKEEPQIQGEVGAIVFIFDEDPDGQKYPYKLTWQAEHENESTLVFYATDFKEDLVGPGIGRCFYGGALFIYPPQFIRDVWEDHRFDDASSPADRLMMAGLYHARDRYVAIVAKKRPSRFIQEYAKTQGKRIVFLPLSSFSHRTLQRLRYFHVLNGRHVRGWAAHFIRGR